MILGEMHFRKRTESVLILTPAQLAKQGRRSVRNSDSTSSATTTTNSRDFNAHDYIIASIDTLRKGRHRQTVLNRDWDILVLDEAHYVKNERDGPLRP